MPTGIYKRTKEMKTGKANKGKPSWNKGKKCYQFANENNSQWKGLKVKYSGLHNWIRDKLGTPKYCEHCRSRKKKKYEWANKDHTYKRDLKDWTRLCTMCHRKYDRDILKSKVGRKKL